MSVIDVEEYLQSSCENEARTESSFRVSSRSYPAGFFAGLHRHDTEEILYLMSGSIRLSVGGVRTTYRQGDIAFIPAHAEHGFVTLEQSAIDIFQPENTTTYITVSNGERGDSEVVVLERVPGTLTESRRDVRYTPSPEIGQRYGATYGVA